MHKQIWKYKISVGDQEIRMPIAAQILTVQMQNGSPHIWALVDPNEGGETRKFEVFGTGQTIMEKARKYIGTFQMHGGALVYHLFERY